MSVSPTQPGRVPCGGPSVQPGGAGGGPAPPPTPTATTGSPVSLGYGSTFLVTVGYGVDVGAPPTAFLSDIDPTLFSIIE